ncbi:MULTISPECIES: alpha/beta fold hydrolase [Methylobacterium]|uniref:alpha/beta fold hydrolase n=1 Tax=Methylobacterium TaxID=407 RepID=UPI0013EB34D4|nr:alpha/beta fold hydrolase [Methylobacterium sp. DB0501]NGM36101.1 alpha/beta fold hydrolase [Methylobacterium sp. DB0501]
MRVLNLLRGAAAGAALSLIALAAVAADYPAPREGDWTVKDFKFHTGEVLPELRLHYTTVGDPKGEPVVVLHGTTGSAASMLTPGFAGELFGPGQPLDAAKYYIVLPDAIGHGKSSKPSDGLRTRFPRYNYDDMAEAQYRLLKEHLGLKHVRLVIGNSMGGMHAWVMGVKHPEFMDALVPMASQPSEMASRNWMTRRLLIETIRRDPGYANGEYTTQPASLRAANVFFALATSGGTLALQKQAPTGALADKLVDARLAAPFNADANDYIYQWDSSRGYDPSPGLEKIDASVLAINSADDERNPPETGIMEREMKRLKNGRLYLIPASTETSGHGTTGFARFYKQQLQDFLQAAPKRAM